MHAHKIINVSLDLSHHHDNILLFKSTGCRCSTRNFRKKKDNEWVPGLKICLCCL